MRKYPLIILIIVLILIFLYSNIVIESVNNSFHLCINHLFPTLFPILMISHLLCSYGFVELCKKLFGNITTKLFKTSSASSYVIILSLISGTPGSAKYIKNLLDENYINIDEANQLLKFTHFINPLFILSIIHNKYIGLIIIISHYCANILIGICFSKRIDISNHNNTPIYKVQFMKTFIDGIRETMNTLLLILGVITSVFIITGLINNAFQINPLFNGLIEVTNGIDFVLSSSIPFKYKILLITFFLSFGGFSIHAQVMSILDNKKIKYIPYLLSRVIQGLISVILIILLLVFHYH